MLVIPAYRESPGLLQRLGQSFSRQDGILVVLVLNRPDSDPDTLANTPLRTAIQTMPGEALSDHAGLYRHDTGLDIAMLDIESATGATPTDQGVGLARKAGCDLALTWMAAGAVTSHWIHCSDADATLPADYFQRLDRAQGPVALFPFRHTPGQDSVCNTATALYELRLHHYVLGLEYAGSPYAFHSLGSCLAISAQAYAQVRGFPKRSGGEDFYLLNKAAKTGTLVRLKGRCIELQSRQSNRVPFGTGPAVAAIAGAESATDAQIFYHPSTFDALRAVLLAVQALSRGEQQQLHSALADHGLPDILLHATQAALRPMGFEAALAHCQRQSRNSEQFMRHFHQWFDGFRTLKLIHAISDAGYSRQSLSELANLSTLLWPGNSHAQEPSEQLQAIYQHWGWN